MIQKTMRDIKMHTKVIPATYGKLMATHIPWLNISGKWLKDAGFNEGELLQIDISEGQLIVRPKATV